ncbi:hypothetical protein BU17DRAFT_75797 [Hysterangium stoloniferum]|nr:hypothetical protein BU17DRAFT_75797 [Hysterangium stoloniferum]
MNSLFPFESPSVLLPLANHPSSKPVTLHLDASKFQRASDADEESLLTAQETTTPSTGSSSNVFTKPVTQGRPRAMTQGSPSMSVLPTTHLRHRSATVANPPKSAPPGSGAPEREKRKRSRVTPEQLTHLERLFAMDRSPTAAKRKEISELLGMQERQTQIWFQNRQVYLFDFLFHYIKYVLFRRAKAKTLEGKGKMGFRGSPHSGGESPPGTPSEFNTVIEGDLQHLIHEDEPVTFIPCSDLTIGSWRRISATLGQHDLVAYISTSKRCLTWFIHSNGYGFKMEIPFDSITSTNFNSASSGQGLATFYLSRPPLFYLESMSSPGIWKKCADWTEGQQASKILRHDLVGAAVPLVNALKCMPTAEHPVSAPAGPMGHPPYHLTETMPPMHIPQPPLANLESHTFPLSAGPHTAHSGLMHGRKRSFSVPAILPQSSQNVSDYSLLCGPQAGPSDHTAPFSGSFSERGSSLAFQQDYSTSLFRSFPSMQPQSNTSHHHSQSSLTDFSTVPISHVAASRPYSASPADTPFPFNSAASSALHGTSDQFSHRGTSPNQFGSISSSPPLLTAAFDPATLHRNFHGTLDMESSQHPRPPSS